MRPRRSGRQTTTRLTETAPNFETQNGSTKSALVSQIARIVREAGLNYDGWRYVAKRVRKACDLKRALRGIAVGRGNWTFVGSEFGGETVAVLYSVVGGCRRLGLDSWAYLCDVFTRLPALTADRWARERAAPSV